MEQRLKLKYRIKYFDNGKVTQRLLVDNINAGFSPRITDYKGTHSGL